MKIARVVECEKWLELETIIVVVVIVVVILPEVSSIYLAFCRSCCFLVGGLRRRRISVSAIHS